MVRMVLSVTLWCLCGGLARFCWVRVGVCGSVAVEVLFVGRLDWVSVSSRGRDRGGCACRERTFRSVR